MEKPLEEAPLEEEAAAAVDKLAVAVLQDTVTS